MTSFRTLSISAITTIIFGLGVLNLYAPLTGSASAVQYPGCWIRDYVNTQELQLTVQNAANVAVYNEPILQKLEELKLAQEELEHRISRLQAERHAFPTLLDTERFMCRRSVGCDVGRIGADTMISSPVLASRKSLQMVDAALAHTRGTLADLKDLKLTVVENLQDTVAATERLHRFSGLPEGCQVVLGTPRLRASAAAMGVSIKF